MTNISDMTEKINTDKKIEINIIRKYVMKHPFSSLIFWKKLSEKLASIALRAQIALPIFSNKNIKIISFGLLLTNNQEIKKFNKRFRNIDKETDVLSFPAIFSNECALSISQISQMPVLELGDIIISLEKLCAQAQEYGHSNEREAAFLLTHGLLHLVGYDHIEKKDEKVMFELQDEILLEAGFPRNDK